MQRDRALHIVKEIHVESFGTTACSDEYLYLLTEPYGSARSSVAQHNVTAHAAQLAFIPLSSLLWTSQFNTETSDFMRSCANEWRLSYTRLEISIVQTQ